MRVPAHDGALQCGHGHLVLRLRKVHVAERRVTQRSGRPIEGSGEDLFECPDPFLESCLEVGGEPSPELIDDAVSRWRSEGIEVVLAVGGGSALDSGKAIAGLLLPGNAVMDHLEASQTDPPNKASKD
jgi:hypothetical protein